MTYGQRKDRECAELMDRNHKLNIKIDHLLDDTRRMERSLGHRSALIAALVGIIAILGVVIWIMAGNIRELENYKAAATRLGTSVETVRALDETFDFMESACGVDIDCDTPSDDAFYENTIADYEATKARQDAAGLRNATDLER
jgi:hypothetical protein